MLRDYLAPTTNWALSRRISNLVTGARPSIDSGRKSEVDTDSCGSEEDEEYEVPVVVVVKPTEQ
jgi:hypothetical protein